MHRLLYVLWFAACGGGGAAESDTDPADTSTGGPDRVVFTTSSGAFTVTLNAEAAPITVENFLAYVDAGFYDGDDGAGATVFHRVIEGFVAQGGGFTEANVQKTTRPPIVLESDNGLSNLRGTIAMARTPAPDSATSQFYVNLVDNRGLDRTGQEPGYAVFGEVTAGMDVVAAIGSAPVTGERPTPAILITDCERAE